ncbi:hypothetical protein H4R33_000746 [Dimargaris cristalligena]|nr:hypothetical protein H4R33_000746 [Dimargaris cristalligena]
MRFAAAPKCPRCGKSVFVAEQVIGPNGPWHRACLTCAQCNVRLDANRLLDSDGEAYCKLCHHKLFGPRGYNLVGGTAPASPVPSDTRIASEIRSRSNSRALGASNPQLYVDARRSPSIPPTPSRELNTPTSSTFSSWGYHQSKPVGPLTPVETTPTDPATAPSPDRPPWTPTTSEPESEDQAPARSPAAPRFPTAATAPQPPKSSTEIGATKSISLVGSGGITPGGWTSGSSYVPRKLNLNINSDQCAKCHKVVYAAESINGVGKKYHRSCFKCTECKGTLSASNLTENDNLPYCKRCYARLFGPKGYGFAGGAAFLTTEGSAR